MKIVVKSLLVVLFALSLVLPAKPAEAAIASVTLRLHVGCFQSNIQPQRATFHAQVKPNNSNTVYSWQMKEIASGQSWLLYEVTGFLDTNIWYSDRYVRTHQTVVVGWQPSWRPPQTLTRYWFYQC